MGPIMSQITLEEIARGVTRHDIVPYLGAGAVADVVHSESGQAMPADSESLILAMNGGQAMAPRLMYEFPRAAMNVELKKGRRFLTRFLQETYSHAHWTRALLHDWLATVKPRYVIDTNRDSQLQDSYAATPHTLIRGVARLGGSDYRFRIHHYDGGRYTAIDQDAVDPDLPTLFKPMGSPLPDPSFIASDADYVDYITELMGGFAIPNFLKQYRQNKQYLILGLRLTRDTERMVLSDMIYGAATPGGWVLIPGATDKERRFCERIGLELIDADIPELLAAASQLPVADQATADLPG